MVTTYPSWEQLNCYILCDANEDGIVTIFVKNGFGAIWRIENRLDCGLLDSMG